MVALGTLISASWILASNSWLQTPQGFAIVNGRVIPVHWLEVIFSPSFPYRLAHMTVAAYLATALFVGAAGAWHLRRGHATASIRATMSMAMWMILIAAPVQIALGDAHGLNTLRYQPAKIAAIEGHWQNTPGESVPLTLVGLPDMRSETTRYAIEVPYLGSLILTHSLHGQFPGLKQFPRQDRPNSAIVFWTFRLMVGLGFLMLLLGVCGAWLRWRGRLFESRRFLRLVTLMGPTGLIALLAGWITTEVGRQPWVVYGVMRTAEGVSNEPVLELSTTLVAFVAVYCILFGTGIRYMLRLVAIGPEEGTGEQPASAELESSRRPARPLSAAPDGRVAH